MPVAGAIAGALMMAFGANACFMLGPVGEIYLAAFLNCPETPTYRKAAFWLGVAGSLGLWSILKGVSGKASSTSSRVGTQW